MKTIATLTIIGALFLPSAALCQNDHKDTASQTAKPVQRVVSIGVTVGVKPFGSHLQPILKAVDASEDQKKSITEITDDFKTRIEPLRKKHDQLREEFLKAISSGQSSANVLSTQMEFNRVQTDLAAQYLALRLKVQNVLTPEQNIKYAQYRKLQGWTANK